MSSPGDESPAARISSPLSVGSPDLDDLALLLGRDSFDLPAQAPRRDPLGASQPGRSRRRAGRWRAWTGSGPSSNGSAMGSVDSSRRARTRGTGWRLR